MGKYENVLKCIQIHRLVEDKKYQKALEAVKAIDMDKVSVVSDLKVIADVYMKMDQYEKAKDVYYRIYSKVKTYRVLYRLIILAIRSGNVQEAEELYGEYEAANQTDADCLILKYRLQKAKGVLREELIRTLEELKKVEYIEEWAYELAKLYHKEGMGESCVNECKDIVLWFGEGEIVNKAKILKKHYDGELDLSATGDLEEVLKEQVSGMVEDVTGQDKEEDVLVTEAVDNKETKRIVIQNTKLEEAQAKEKKERLSETQKISDKIKVSAALKLNEILKTHEEADEEALAKGMRKEEELREELREEAPREETSKEEALPEETLSEETPQEERQEPPEQEQLEQEPPEQEPIEQGQVREGAGGSEEGLEEEPHRTGYRRKFMVVEEFFVSLINSDKEIQVVIAGEEDRFILAVVKKITKKLREKGYISDDKIAKIHAEKLNKVDLKKKPEELLGHCVLVEEASKLDAETVGRLQGFMEEYPRKVVVILTDFPERMKKMLQEYGDLDEKITHFLEI